MNESGRHVQKLFGRRGEHRMQRGGQLSAFVGQVVSVAQSLANRRARFTDSEDEADRRKDRAAGLPPAPA